MDKEQKTEVISSYSNIFSEYGSSGTIVLVEYAGIDVAGLKSLRNNLTKGDAQMVVVKNRLAKIALSNIGGDCSFLEEYFKGPISIVYSKDPVYLAKSLVSFAKVNEALKLKIGVMDGKSIDISGIKVLSSLPSLDELRAKLLSLLMAPPRGILCILNNLPSGLVRLLKTKNEKDS